MERSSGKDSKREDKSWESWMRTHIRFSWSCEQIREEIRFAST